MAKPPKPAAAGLSGADEVIANLQEKIAALSDASRAIEDRFDQAASGPQLKAMQAQIGRNEAGVAECDRWITALEAGKPFTHPTQAQTSALLSAMQQLGAATAASAAISALLTAADKVVKAYKISFGAGAAAAATSGTRRRAAAGPPARTFDARPDTVDFRDQMFVPTLVDVPAESDMAGYLALGLPVLNQGKEGACTGFGLAAVANYLNRQRQLRPLRVNGALPAPMPPADECSARMLYVLARRYDEWDGEAYDWSSCRGAMKGWHKHGVCALTDWPDNRPPDSDLLTETRARAALDRPLGAYFRVNHKDLVAMHSAIAEVGVLYVSCQVHTGWQKVGAKGVIAFESGIIGGHAFAVVGYDRQGFWLQNSWGPTWGKGGLAHLSYADWLANGTDAWVARLGAPVDLSGAAAAQMLAGAPASYASYVYSDLRPHVVTVGNDGSLRSTGDYGLTTEALERILRVDLVERVKAWPKKRVLLYAHGGLTPEDYSVQYAANRRQRALDSQIYPINFIWRSDAWTTLENILRDAIPGLKAAGYVRSALDFMLDRFDDSLEPVARALGGKAMWDEMKENALRATTTLRGAARKVADELAARVSAGEIDEIHLAGHSAGAVFTAALASYLGTSGKIGGGPLAGQTGLGLKIASVSLWAPACTMGLYYQTYQPLIDARQIGSFGVYTLKDSVEQGDNCAHIYNKSLLYLVSHALEQKRRVPPGPGEPLLGLEKDIAAAPRVSAILKQPGNAWIHAPDGRASGAENHGGFDVDDLTWKSTLSRIRGAQPAAAAPTAFSAEGARRLRRAVSIATGMR